MHKKDTIKKAIIISAAILALIVAIIVIASIINQNNQPTEEIVMPKGLAEDVLIQTKEFTYNNSMFEVDMEVPEITNLNGTFNSYINNKINSDTSYRNVYNELTSGISDLENIGKFTYEVNYERYNCQDYLSLLINQSIQLGEERAINRVLIYVIDAKNSRLLLLQDVMENKIDYKKKITEEINVEAFKNRVELIGGNGLGSISDDQKFYIKDAKLHIYYDASEIAPASVGSLDFEMPFEYVNGVFTY